MDIQYKNIRLKKKLNDFEILKREYEEKIAKKILIRLTELQAAENLEIMTTGPPHFRHRLEGKRRGQFAIDITRKYKIIIEPMNGELERLYTVTGIKIIEVSNHYSK